MFSTTDKDSNIDHYKICELFSCVTGGSPYLLKNQTLFYNVIVYAYDTNGNSQMSYLISPWLVLAIVGFVFVLILIIFRRYFYPHKI